MPEEVTINFSTILAICGFVVAVGGAAHYIKRFLKPLFKPYEDVQNNIEAIEQRSVSCAKKFANDEQRLEQHEKILQELTEDTRIILISVSLLLQHAETGNSTGDIAKGRKELETYLIQRRDYP